MSIELARGGAGAAAPAEATSQVLGGLFDAWSSLAVLEAEANTGSDMSKAGQPMETMRIDAKTWLSSNKSKGTRDTIQLKWAMRQLQVGAGRIRSGKSCTGIIEGLRAKCKKKVIADDWTSEIVEWCNKRVRS